MKHCDDYCILTVVGLFCPFCEVFRPVQKKTDWSRISANDSIITTRKILCYYERNKKVKCIDNVLLLEKYILLSSLNKPAK